MDAPIFEQAIEERILERRRVAGVTSVSRQLLAHAEPSVVVGLATDTLMARMEALVLVDPSRRRTKDIEIVSDPVFDSWQEQKVEQYPMGSFRRRFWAYFYGLDPDARYGYRTRQGVHIHQEAVLPESAHEFPGHGPMHITVHAHRTPPERVEP